jgi:hypothetical protein
VQNGPKSCSWQVADVGSLDSSSNGSMLGMRMEETTAASDLSLVLVLETELLSY